MSSARARPEKGRPAHIPDAPQDDWRPGVIAAVVVTHDRRELLRECLGALSSQTRPPDRILVVDNASTDGTLAMLRDEFPTVEALALIRNFGGAGGFHTGIKKSYEDGCDWLWLMDDDTIPTPKALENLLSSHFGFPVQRRPSLLASKVLWTDGSLHFMNGAVVGRDRDDLLLAAEHSTLSIRSCTFVSCLLQRDIITYYGLPLADYFIWGDDTEFTARVLRSHLGVMVPSSVVIHKTARKHTALDAAPERFYYHVRNSLWIVLRSDAWTTKEKLRYLLTLIAWIGRYLQMNHFRGRSLQTVLRGLRDGLFSRARERDLTPFIRRLDRQSDQTLISHESG